jgi:hypothetical protein
VNPSTKRKFLFSRMSSLALRPTQPPIQWLLGLFPGNKVMVHEIYLSPPSNADIKSEWSYTCAPLVRLHGIGRDNFIFYFDISVIIFILYGNVWSEHNSLSKVAQMEMHDSWSGVPTAHQTGLTLWTGFLWFFFFSAAEC